MRWRWRAPSSSIQASRRPPHVRTAFKRPGLYRGVVRGETNSDPFRGLGFLFCGLQHNLTRILLNDRQQTGVEKADLEQYEKRQRAVDAVGQGIEHGGGEIQPER